jgi:Tfp pilus assembly protein PilP
MRIQKIASAGLLLALMGAACTSGGGGAPATPAPAPKPPEPKIASVDEEQTFEEYAYDPGGKRDPFRPPQEMFENRVAENPQGEAQPVGPPATPLEELDVVEWKLTAVIQTPGAPRAMVEDASGRGYIIEVGTTIGRWKGKVARIEDDRVIVVETYKDQRGGEKRQEIPLMLRNPEEKDKEKS